MTDAIPQQQKITINADALRDLGMRGVNRAAGFLGLAFRRPDEPLPTTITMSEFNRYQFLPEPLPEVMAGELVQEFNAWLIGNALQELDRHFSLFVDEVWRLLDLTDAHEKVIPAGLKVSEISGDTNAGNKFKKVADRLGLPEARPDRLWSISNARNCLAHAAGMVTERHANDNKQRLKLVWLASEIKLVQGEQFVIIGEYPIQAPDPEQEAQLVVQMVDRELTFEIGQQLRLTPVQLHELCLFYAILIDTIMVSLGEHFAAKGIPNLPPMDQEARET
ncbi:MULTISPECIES: hypothetical protein [unclassified Brevundimonas]|uniref:hypothetical protein n=1 Tax=unclassified Brevundimonas TaxID=2622653 RepID=UPI000CFBDA3F|nr:MULTISPECIES: hypothetical protein [unclassified Brevundimonas]PRA30409.1 hypothetical protein CQ024_07630 [Brevundimonas sp. MYb27]PQZ83314.1 hypothetical protein CQ026_05985 [Brevundimonas sp. MYb31]PRB16153.1 hypothetical protein CQ039_05380 [Brevundimonas sp. MYb52]PRB35236.1 hypothetical protein CQ035_09160 [Brevundimonas sp. MYb46]PRB46131.1 hypothetical protein CQ028_12105 [Brevundimonas sp. MYb33]